MEIHWVTMVFLFKSMEIYWFFNGFSRILTPRTGSRIFCQKNLRLDRVEKTSFGQRTELNADRDSTLGSLRWDPKTSCHWARRLAVCDQHEKMKSGVKVCAATYKIHTKNFYFLQGHSAPPRNFCRALSEIQERRLERLERLRDETRAPGILLPLSLVSTDGPWVVYSLILLEIITFSSKSLEILENSWILEFFL